MSEGAQCSVGGRARTRRSPKVAGRIIFRAILALGGALGAHAAAAAPLFVQSNYAAPHNMKDAMHWRNAKVPGCGC